MSDDDKRNPNNPDNPGDENDAFWAFESDPDLAVRWKASIRSLRISSRM